jgi:ubiquinone/menaquinone biosynthesis C-methylase UbiE
MTSWEKKREIMQRYDVTADIYEMRYAEEQKLKIETAFKEVEIKRYGTVLDVGCGTGILFDYVADKAEKVVGLDVSRKTLLQAKRRAKNFGNIHLVLADADNMPIKERVFDYVFGITLLQNMPEPNVTLREVNRVAKEDAKIIVTGMKKAFTFRGFKKLLSEAALDIVAFKDKNLKCYVAVCVKLSR